MRRRVIFEPILAIVVVLLLFSVYLMVSHYAFMTSTTNATVEWDAASNGSVYYITACNDGTLRALVDGHVFGIDQRGNAIWRVDIPDKWWVGSRYFKPAVAAGKDGSLYVYLRANVTRAAIENNLPYAYPGDYYVDKDDQNKRLMDAYAGTDFAASLNETVLAIAPDGTILWNMPLSTGLYNAGIQVENDTIYVYHGFNETAVDKDGKVLWDVGDIGAAPAVDDAGYVYSVVPIRYGEPGGNILSGIVQAYYPNGTLYWRHDIGDTTYVQDGDSSMPLLDHDTLYVPLSDGVTAMGPDGTTKWTKHYNGTATLFGLAPFDRDGNIYVRIFDDTQGLNGSRLSILKPDGSELALTDDTADYTAAGDGIGYEVEARPNASGQGIEDLGSAVMTARSLKDNRVLWSYNFTPGATNTAIVNETNLKSLFVEGDVKNALMLNGMNRLGGYNFTPSDISGNSFVRIIPGKDVTYASFWTYNYDEPAIYNLSRVTYSGGLYAFDHNGRLLWSRPIDSLIGSLYERDGTIYYSTGDGSMSAAHVDVATGLALAAIVYVIIRFGVIGAVSRARGALNKNENRNNVLKYVKEHPGSTMYEISRSMGINKGTVRYHLFILGINHRIASQRADKKFVRYFPNSNTYTREEQLIMSLLRRDSIRKVLSALIRKPGLSNIQLSQELNLPESAMSKHMKELCARDLVIKQWMAGSVSYRIKDEAKSTIVKALECIHKESL